MNTFKTVVVICAMMAASCSGQYMSQSWANKGSQMGNNGGLSGMMGGQSVFQASTNQQFASNTPAFTVEQQIPAASPLVRPASTLSASATTQQICSCVNINSAASVQQSTAAASSAAEFATPAFTAPQQQTFAAPQQQTFAAPQQQTFSAPQEQAAPQQQFASAVPAAAQQQAYAAPVQSHRRY